MRGSCPTHLILCHRAEMSTLRDCTEIAIPPLSEVVQLNESVAHACGAFPKPKTIGIALNTSKLTDGEALEIIKKLENETGLPVTDVVRYGAEKLGKPLL
ncbi:MAG: NAD-dependent epimerase/dehydratase family protein, partial [Maribacter sp.]|nr:NAD-dependent epimerase/dehydratase family protein [Maribacter sp.]